MLEISIAAGPFVDIITAGGTFVSGGYNGTIGVTDSVLTGRQAWTGNGGGFITTDSHFATGFLRAKRAVAMAHGVRHWNECGQRRHAR